MKNHAVINRTRAVLLATAVAGAAVPVSAGAEEVIFNIMVPQRSTLYRDGFKPWMAEMERLSNGTLTFNVPPASMSPPQRQMDLVRKGVADFAFAPNAYLEPAVQLPNVAGLPFGARTAEAASVALWRTYERYFADVGEYRQVKVLGLFTLGEAVIQTKDPMPDMKSINGVKIRTAPGIQAQIAEAIGAVPVPASGVKQFELVNSGVVDANIGSIESAALTGVDDLLKHFTRFEGGINRTSVVVFMNQDRYDSLPDEARAAIDSTAYERLSRALGKRQDIAFEAAISKLEKTGVTIGFAPPAIAGEAAPALQFIKDDWLKAAGELGVDGRAALDFYLATVRDIEGAQ